MKQHFVRTLCGLGLMAAMVAALPVRPAQAQVKVILDTDMDLDVDDAGALALLHTLADKGEADILGVILDSPSQRNGNSRLGTATISAINTYYMRPGIPIGDLPPSEYMNNPPNYQRYRNYGNGFADPGAPATDDYVYYNEYIKSHFPNGNVAAVYDSKALYRKLLAAAPDGSVTVIGVGLFRALNDLMYTGADQYSSLTGKQLIAKKVKRLVLMTGESRFDGLYHYSDGFNSTFEGLGDAARVFNQWPTSIVIMPLGGGIGTGARLSTETPATNPVRKSYELFLEQKGGRNRSSWDLLAVLYGVRGAGSVFIEKTGRNIEGNWIGRDNPNYPSHPDEPLEYRWDTLVSSDKPDILLDKKGTISNDQVARLLDDLIVQPPTPKYGGKVGAEAARLSGVVFSQNYSGYQGTGYANFGSTSTEYVEWNIKSATADPVVIRFRYSNGYSDARDLKLTVNGVVVDANLTFDSTGGWANWTLSNGKTANFVAGENEIRLTGTGVGGPDIDGLEYEVLQSGLYQAEDAVLSGTTFSQYNPGYQGTGYANYGSSNTEYVEWTVDKDIASQVNLKFRYANGFSDNRPLKLTVNGVVVASSLTFNPTENWTTWAMTSGINANFVAGQNKVRLTGTGVSGVNMDSLSFTSSPSANITGSGTSSAPSLSANSS